VRYVLIGLIVCVVLGTYLVATRPVEEPAPGQVVLRFGFPGTVQWLSAYARLIRRFTERNPDIYVKLEPFTGDFRRIIQRDLVAAIAPDIFFSDDDDFAVFADGGHYLPLDRFIQRDGLDLGAYYPPTIASFQWKGKQYGLPLVWGFSLLFYNKDVFREAGITYDPLTWTWDEFLDALRRLTKTVVRDGAEVQQFGYIRDNASHTMCHIWQAGGAIIKRVLKCPHCGFENEVEDMPRPEDLRCGKCGRPLSGAEEYWIGKMNTPETLAGVKFAASLMKYTPMQQASHTSDMSMNRELFSYGRLAIIRGGPYSPAWLKDTNINWGIGYYPAGPGGRWTRFYCDGIAIWAKTTHPEEAWRLMKFLVSAEAQRVLAKEGASVPALKEVAESPYFNRPDTPWDESKFVKAIHHARFQRKTPEWDAIQQAIGRYHDLLMLPEDVSSRISPEEFCRLSQREIEKILGRSRR